MTDAAESLADHLDRLAALAASLPSGAVLAHVVTEMVWERSTRRPMIRVQVPRAWAKIGDEPWRSVAEVLVRRFEHPYKDGICGRFEWCDPAFHPDHVGLLWIVTDSVVWEQDYGLRGRHEVMGVIG